MTEKDLQVVAGYRPIVIYSFGGYQIEIVGWWHKWLKDPNCASFEWYLGESVKEAIETLKFNRALGDNCYAHKN